MADAGIGRVDPRNVLIKVSRNPIESRDSPLMASLTVPFPGSVAGVRSNSQPGLERLGQASPYYQ